VSLHPHTVDPIPEQTDRIARAAYRRGTPFMHMRDEIGTLFTDEAFAPLFPTRGRPATSPWRFALVCVMQYVEGLSDRQSADAVHARIDWAQCYGRYGIARQGLNQPLRAFRLRSLAVFRLTLPLSASAAAHTPDRTLPHCVRPPRQYGAACAPPHSAPPQGNRISTGDDLAQIALIPTRLEALVLDSRFRGRLFLQQVERDVPQHHQIRRARSRPRPALILSEGDVQHPVQPVLDPQWPRTARPNVAASRRLVR